VQFKGTFNGEQLLKLDKKLRYKFISEGILVKDRKAEFVACPQKCSEWNPSCSLSIMEYEEKIIGLCNDLPEGPVEIEPVLLERYQFSMDAFARNIVHANGMTGEHKLVCPGTYFLGMYKNSRNIFVLTPSKAFTNTIFSFLSGESLYLSLDVTGEDKFTYIGDVLAPLTYKLTLPEKVTLETRQHNISDKYCRVISSKFKRSLTREEYESLLKKSEEYDMFIDGHTRKCHKRNEKGKIISSSLTPNERRILTEYIDTGKNMRPAQTKTGVSQKVFSTARSKVDIKTSRYKFRAFTMYEGETSETNSYQFNPKDTKYCLIIPL